MNRRSVCRGPVGTHLQHGERSWPNNGFGPDWEQGCDGCTEVADNFNGIVEYLQSRDASMVAISRTSLEKIEGYRARMGWTFRWISSLSSDFNFDFNVSYRDPGKSRKMWNFRSVEAAVEETHGVSVFLREGNEIFHTYSCHSRAVDLLCANMQYLDLLPKGRQDNLWHDPPFRRR